MNTRHRTSPGLRPRVNQLPRPRYAAALCGLLLACSDGTSPDAGVATVSIVAPATLLYQTQQLQLVATTRDAHGAVLTGREVDWTTSDAQRAVVDGTGKVTAVGAGAVTITARSGGAEAVVELTSIARPAADWSGAADWWTFNGNAERTGYVPVTVDPTVLRMLWNDMVLSGLNLQPVAEADGRAFVASGIRWGVQTTEQRLAAVNVQTGALIWSHSFGPVPFLNPPTVSGGLVYASTVGHSLHYLWAFDAATGAVVFSAPYDNQWSLYGAPAVGGGGVYMGGGYVGGIYAFSAADGTPHWFTDFGYEWIWADQWTPAFRAGRVYAYLGMKNSAAVSVGKFVVADAATGAAQVLIDDPDFVFDNSLRSSAVLGSANNALMTLRNRLVSFDVANQRIGWQIEAAFRGTVTLADGVIYVINGQRVEARSEQDGALLWYWTSPDSNLLGAVIATRNLLFVSTPNSVYAIDIGARVHTWRHVGGGHLSLTRDGVLLIAEESGVLTAIGLK